MSTIVVTAAATGTPRATRRTLPLFHDAPAGHALLGPPGEPFGGRLRCSLSDLRELGSLEQDADMVILVHRPDAWEADDPRAGEADLIIAKHRNGPTATIAVAHQLHYSRFADLAG